MSVDDPVPCRFHEVSPNMSPQRFERIPAVLGRCFCLDVNLALFALLVLIRINKMFTLGL